MSTTEQVVGELLNEQDWTGKIFRAGRALVSRG